MTRPASQWSDLDREAMRLVFDEWNTRHKELSLRAASRAIGVSAPRVMDLRDGRHGKPTVEEFCDLCTLLGLDPGRTLNEARHNIS